MQLGTSSRFKIRGPRNISRLQVFQSGFQLSLNPLFEAKLTNKTQDNNANNGVCFQSKHPKQSTQRLQNVSFSDRLLGVQRMALILGRFAPQRLSRRARHALSGSSYAPVQRRAVPKPLEEPWAGGVRQQVQDLSVISPGFKGKQ